MDLAYEVQAEICGENTVDYSLYVKFQSFGEVEMGVRG